MTDKETRYSAQEIKRESDAWEREGYHKTAIMLAQAASDLEQRERDQQRIAELERDAERMDWFESQAKTSYMCGFSFDYPPACESEPGGYRFLRNGLITEQRKTLREAIDAAMEKTK